MSGPYTEEELRQANEKRIQNQRIEDERQWAEDERQRVENERQMLYRFREPKGLSAQDQAAIDAAKAVEQAEKQISYRFREPKGLSVQDQAVIDTAKAAEAERQEYAKAAEQLELANLAKPTLLRLAKQDSIISSELIDEYPAFLVDTKPTSLELANQDPGSLVDVINSAGDTLVDFEYFLPL